MSLKSLTQSVFFEGFYRFTTPPWAIDQAQPDLMQLEAEGVLKGRSILDVGCGTGDNAIYLAQRGYRVAGIDFSSSAIKIAHRKAQDASVKVDFRVFDALKLSDFSETVESVIDYGLFHQFSGTQLKQYVNSLATVLQPEGRLIVQCFSDREPTREVGPRLVSQQDIRDAFTTGWRINWIRPAKYHANGREPYLSWLASITRTVEL